MAEAASLSQALQAQLADRALAYGTPGTIPYVQRSAYLADALQNIQQNSGQNIRTRGALVTNLLADAILQFSKGRADKALMARETSDQDAYSKMAMSGLTDPTAQQAPPAAPGASGAPLAGALQPQAPQAPPVASGLADAVSPPPQAPPSAPPPVQGGILGQNITPPVREQVESGGNPNAVSSAGAQGLAQVMPGTGADPGFGVRPLQDSSPEENARLGRDYFDAMKQRYGNQVYAAVANNWGPGHADRWVKAGAQFDHLPRETQLYLGKLAVEAAHGQPPQPAGMGAAPAMAAAPMAPQPSPFAPPAAGPPSPAAGTSGPGAPSSPPGPASPPTGQGPTPQEWHLVQSLLASPYPAMKQQGAALALKLRERQATPIDPTKPMWDQQRGKYVQPPGLSFQDMPGAPNEVRQRGPDGQIHVTADPSYGSLPSGSHMDQSGNITPAAGRRILSPEEVSKAGYAPGTVVELDPMTGQRTVQQDPQAALTQRLQTSRDSFRTNDDVKKANEGIAAFNGLSSAITRAAGNNGVLDVAATDSLLRGINPGMGARNTTVTMFLNHLGWPEELKGHLANMFGNGFITPTILQQMLPVIKSYADAHVGIAQNLANQDLTAFKGYGVTPDQLGENLTTYLPEPHVKWMDPAPAAPGGAPRMSGTVAAAELQRRGYHHGPNGWTK